MNAFKTWFHKLGSPPFFYEFAGYLRPWLWVGTVVFAIAGLIGGLIIAPPDYQQGDAYRIIFIHVPSAWMSLFIYGVMAISGLIAVVWRMKLAEIIAMESAPIGAAFTFITLITGSLWGKPMWGTYWTWDARLTSELVLLFIYLGIIGLYHAFENERQGARAASFLIIVGVVNLPIVHYSVVWWNTLHQGTTVRIFAPSSISLSMLWPILAMMIATKLYYGVSLLGRARIAVLERERGKDWVRQIVMEGTKDA